MKFPKDWTVEKLSDLSVDGINNGTFFDPKKTGTGCRHINIDQMYIGPRISTEGLKLLNVDDATFKKKQAQYGDVFFTRSSLVWEGIAHCNVLLDRSPDFTFDDHLMRVRPKTDKIFPQYLNEYCRTFPARKFFLTRAKRSTMTTIGQDDIGDLEVGFPSLDEQKKIVDILSTWDEAIEKLYRQIKSLESKFDWFLADLLSPRKTQNKDQTWKTYKLCELASFINGRGFKQSEWTTSGLPIIRIQNMNGSSEFNYYDGEYDKRHFINRGDLLFSWSGSRGTSFGPNIWSGSPGLLNQHIFKVENTEQISKEFLYLVLKYATKIIERKAHGGSGLVHVTKSELEKFEVDLPGDKTAFLVMSKLLLSKEVELKLLNRKLELFRIQKQGLMQQLLTGKKRVKV